MTPKKANAFMEFVYEWRLTNPEGLGMSYHPLVRMDLARREAEESQEEMRSSTERMVLEALKKLGVAKC